MQYNSKECEDREFKPIRPGRYGFTVVGADEQVSQKNNEMIALELQVDIPGRDNPVTVYDYLVAVPAALFKVKQFCDCVGLDFENNQLTGDECMGKNGEAAFKLGLPKDDGNRYLEVKSYLSGNYTESPKPTATVHQGQSAGNQQESANLDDDIPF